MLSITSLKRITEAADPTDIRHTADIAKANAEYDKVAGPPGPLSLPRRARWLFTPDKKVAEAAADRSAAVDAADARRKAGKLGMASKEDYDEARYQAAKTNAALKSATNKASEAKEAAGEHASESGGIISKIGKHIGEHKLGYGLAGLATVAGLAALQKRRKNLPEPGQY